MAWFDDLKAALPKYYPGGRRETIVGYFRGTTGPAQWRSMESIARPQMIILGSQPPAQKDWIDAGVSERGASLTKTLTISMLNGFIILYGGGTPRPWGKIFTVDADALRTFPSCLESWKRNSR